METTFSKQLQKLRKQSGITQEQLAAKLGVTAQAVSKWENGSYPDGDLLPKIADIFDVSIDNLFISSRGYKENPLTVKSLHFALTSYLEKADIDYTGKRHGFHSLRSSLSSSMVNDNVPYDIVRKVLGHTSDDSIKHYARLDIEELRKCSIEVPAPSGKFKIFLEDGILL